jgi:hypothetical protein
MTSIFTGLAFMHGHLVDRELVLRLGRAEPAVGKGGGRKARVRGTPEKRAARKPPLTFASGCG